jgi:pentatricopeptide repeat protein
MIAGYSKNGYYEETMDLFGLMHRTWVNAWGIYACYHSRSLCESWSCRLREGVACSHC